MAGVGSSWSRWPNGRKRGSTWVKIWAWSNPSQLNPTRVWGAKQTQLKSNWFELGVPLSVHFTWEAALIPSGNSSWNCHFKTGNKVSTPLWVYEWLHMSYSLLFNHLRWCYTGQLATPTCNTDSQRMFFARICRHVTLLNRFQKLPTRCSTAISQKIVRNGQLH